MFKIENGKIKNAMKNFRWNGSPVSVLPNIDAMSQEYRPRERVRGLRDRLPRRANELHVFQPQRRGVGQRWRRPK